MRDIVERLRSCPGLGDPNCNCLEAADEIERLREVLESHEALLDAYASITEMREAERIRLREGLAKEAEQQKEEP